MSNFFQEHLINFKPYISQHDEADFQKIRLNQNEGLINFPKELVDRATNRIALRINYYPDPDSMEVIELYAKKIGLDKTNIIITNGSNNALEIIARATLNENAEIVIDSPTYDVMRMQAGIQNAKIIHAYSPDPFSPTVDHLVKSITPATTAIYVANPANPIGKMYPPKEIEKLLRTEKLIILDEAYIDYAPANSAALIRKDKNLIIVRTLSKAYLAAGLRIGFIISHADNVAILKKITPPWALNHISQSLAYELLSSDSLFNNYVNIVSVSKTYLYEELNKMGVTFYPSHTNFILIKFENVDEIVQELDKQDILVSNKSKLKGLEGCMRVTIGPIEVMKHFVFALKSILQKK